MLFIIVFPDGITWLSPSNRRRSAVASELATAELLGYFTSSKSKASVNQLLAEKRQNARRTRQLTDSAMLITLLRKVRLFPPNFQENLRVFNKKIIST